MNVILPYLQCELTQEEFVQGIGAEFPEKFIVCPNGKIFKRVELSHGRYVQYQVESIPTKDKKKMPELKDEIHFLPAGKVPVSMYHQIVDFFKKVMIGMNGTNLNEKTQHGALEAMAHIVWNPKQDPSKYQIRIPTQKVSAATVSYEFDHLEDGDVIIVDIHSHNNMGAFFSGTDDGDDKKNTCYSGVVGKLNTNIPEHRWRFNDLDKKKFNANFDDIFLAESVSCPKEWLDKVTRQTYSNLYSGSYGGGNRFGGGRNMGKGRGGDTQRGNTGKVVGIDGLPLVTDDEDDDLMSAYGIPPSGQRGHLSDGFDFSELEAELGEYFGAAYPWGTNYETDKGSLLGSREDGFLVDPALIPHDPVLRAIHEGELPLKNFAVTLPRFIQEAGDSKLWVDKYSEDSEGNCESVTEEEMSKVVESEGGFMMYVPMVDTYIISADIEDNSTPEDLLEIYASTIEVPEEDDDILFGEVDQSMSRTTIQQLMEFLKNGTTYLEQLYIVAYLQRISSSGELDKLMEEAGLTQDKGEKTNASIH